MVAVILAGNGSPEAWLRGVVAVEPELRLWSAELLLIVAASVEEAEALRRRLGSSGLTLLDPGGEFHRRVGAVTPDGAVRPALLIIDRAGELRHRLDAPSCSSEELAAAVDWARYLGVQEPECQCCCLAEGWGESE